MRLFDDNNSNDLLLSLRYALRRENPGINTGYRFRYLDFNRQSLGGYFDPEGFLSHQLYLHATLRRKNSQVRQKSISASKRTREMAPAITKPSAGSLQPSDTSFEGHFPGS
jgi:hypothetical protein